MSELHYCGWNWWFQWTTSDVEMHRYQQCRYYFEVFLGSSKYVWSSKQSANWPGTPGVLALYYQLFYVMEDENRSSAQWPPCGCFPLCFFCKKFLKSLTCGIGLGYSTDCAQLDHHLSECGWQVNCKLLWGLNFKVRPSVVIVLKVS